VTRAGARATWVAVFVAALAVLVRSPVLGAGFVSDDTVLVAGIEGRSPLGNTPYALWSFYDGVPAHNEALVRGGGLPWWTGPTASHAFFRPLSSALLVAAHAAFGRHPAGYYAVLLVLCGANVLAAGALFARLLPRPAAVCAQVAFAFHALHADPTRWISTIHLQLGMLALALGWWAFLRWRDDRWRPGVFLAPVGFALALLAGEAALGALAYVACREAAPPRKPGWRSAAAIPVALGAAYVVVYRALHEGPRAIEGYLDPLVSPGRALPEIADRFSKEVPRLLTASADGTLAGLGRSADAAAVPVLVATIAVLVGLAATFDRDALRRCAWWAAAALLCALPALLGPTDRGLYPATLGSSAVLGLLVASAWGVASGRSGAKTAVRVVAGAAAAIVVLAHVGLGAYVTLDGARAMAATSSDQRRAVSSVRIDDPPRTDVVVLAAYDQPSGPWGGVVYGFATGDVPRSWQALALGSQPHAVARLADDTFEMTPAGGDGFSMHLYRDTAIDPMRVGDHVATPGLTVEVVDVDAAGRPRRIRVRADRSLDDPSFAFVTRGRDRLVRVRLPAVGQGVWLR
jgi:hypothetical protein